jgi:hypothetical protein
MNRSIISTKIKMIILNSNKLLSRWLMIARKMERLSLMVFKVYSISPNRGRKSSVSSIPVMAWSAPHNLDHPKPYVISSAQYSAVHNRTFTKGIKFNSWTDNFTLREKDELGLWRSAYSLTQKTVQRKWIIEALIQ